ncbi:MAG: ribonuclease III [Roseburia sp.]|nr:ribonuclease III [Anaeroplasma bactoclasticum]MCM1195987.1 ribonuclease III [Roseburia sp.]MCM1556817.1 ribonuclease III [Anaeroplasma bactoclasticum]
MDFLELENQIGYHFHNLDLLKLALTHSSYANEHQMECNERLEYLGDAVLQLCMSKYLFKKLHLDEGVLSKTRAKCVCEEALNVYAEKIHLARYLLLGNGEEHSGGRGRPAIIADAFEAMLGAILEDSNFETVYQVFERIVLPHQDIVLKIKDYKSVFQEKVQADKRSLHYEIVHESGPANDKTYEAVVYMDEILMGRGIGKTKKEAEQNAAKEALNKEARG